MDPDFAEGRRLLAANRPLEALKVLEQAMRRHPRDAQIMGDFCITCATTGEVEYETQVLSELEPIVPDNAVLLAYLGQALAEVGQYQASLRAYERSLAISPDVPTIRVAYGIALLRLGDFLRGWEFYDAREGMNELSKFTAPVVTPRYTGGNLHGRTLLLLSEQGLGDTLMFARYAPLLAKRGAKVIIVAHQEIAELLRTVPGVWQVIPFGTSLPSFHTHARLLGLPKIFSTTLWTIPQQTPYLRAPQARVERWRARLANDGHGSNVRRVGLVWAGNSAHTRDVHRSMHLSDLAPLADVPNTVFYSLQKGSRQDEVNAPPPGMRLTDLTPEIKDFSDLAAAVQALDLLITVDTGPAHLAGALGKPVWTLIAFSPDWRWLLDRNDSPWYPTMRLFRQPKIKDWKSVVAEVRNALLTPPQDATARQPQ